MTWVRRVALLLVLGAATAWLVRRLSGGDEAFEPFAGRVPTPGTPSPTPSPSPAVQPGEYPGSALALEGGASPGPTYVVKGNVNSMKFHEPDSPWFEATIAEVWFETAEAARTAGFKHAGDRH